MTPPPPSRYDVWSVEGINPVEGFGVTYDGRHFYFRAQGRKWELGISLLPAPPRVIARQSSFKGDGMDVVLSGAAGWYLQAPWPTPGGVKWRSRLTTGNPASYMPHAEVLAILNYAIAKYKRGDMPKRVRRQARRAAEPDPYDWRTWRPGGV